MAGAACVRPGTFVHKALVVIAGSRLLKSLSAVHATVPVASLMRRLIRVGAQQLATYVRLQVICQSVLGA